MTSRVVITGLLCAAAVLGQGGALAQQPPPPKAASDDPFAGVAEKPTATAPAARGWFRSLFTENFGFRKEIMSQFTSSADGNRASRQSLGFEVLKKFSTDTATVASFNFQGRLVRRDGFNAVRNDMEGEHRPGWVFEYHNVYLDLYNVFNPLLGDKQRGRQTGRFNIRAGRFYVPFGLNLQTDTHGTVLQLSNDRNFGFERDWYTGLWGSVNSHLNYDAYYLLGSGYDVAFRGQRGLAALRMSLSNKYLSEYGLEGGVSVLGGERLLMNGRKADTRRAGVDGRYRRAVPTGLLTLTSEGSGGRDGRNAVAMQLHQAEYLRASRRWGVGAQYRRFREAGYDADAAVIGEFSWYFRNDAGNSNLHWIKFNVEHSRPRTVVTLQYYFYR